MPDLFFRIEFWIAMVFAIIIKLRASPTITWIGAILTTVSAVSGALIFTEPLTEYLALNGEGVTFAVAALVALSCEHVARIVLNTTLADFIRMWRGK